MTLPSALLGFAVFKTIQRHYSGRSPSDGFMASIFAEPFTDVENVFVQSLCCAVGVGPLCFGFVGIIPALEKFLTPEEAGLSPIDTNSSAAAMFMERRFQSTSPVSFSLTQLLLWGFALSFVGVYFGVLLRIPIIVKEKLRFPSGSATATMIAVLHQTEIFEFHGESAVAPQGSTQNSLVSDSEREANIEFGSELASPGQEEELTNVQTTDTTELENLAKKTYSENIRILVISFGISASYSLISYFFPILRDIPLFGNTLAKEYLWTFQPSPAYFGQGIIMGFPTVASMLFGAFLGWGVLGPMSKHLGWAPGAVDDWKTGAQGWILWISLAIMVADTVISFIIVTGISFYKMSIFQKIKGLKGFKYFSKLNVFNSAKSKGRLSSRRNSGSLTRGYQSISEDDSRENEEAYDDIDLTYGQDINEHEPDSFPKHTVSTRAAIIGLVLSSVFCIIVLKITFLLPMNKTDVSPGFKFDIPIYPLTAAVLLALPLAILGVRALGETDLNPVSGIGKISQLIFALLVPPSSHPAAVLINLVAGGVTEAGALQAGDLMQDLKTGHLIGASPRAQFVAQIIGALWSVPLSAFVYRLYDKVYEIPGTVFRIPTAVVWIDCARLVTGQGLPEHASLFALVFGAIFGVIAIIKALAPIVIAAAEPKDYSIVGTEPDDSFIVDEEEDEEDEEEEEEEESRLAKPRPGTSDTQETLIPSDLPESFDAWADGAESSTSSERGIHSTPVPLVDDKDHSSKSSPASRNRRASAASHISISSSTRLIKPSRKASPGHISKFFSAIGSFLFTVVFPVAKHARFLPTGVVVGIGIYNTPSFTLARFLGGAFAAYWMKYHSQPKKPGESNDEYNASLKIVILSSGLVLGEGVFSIVSLLLTSFGVPHF